MAKYIELEADIKISNKTVYGNEMPNKKEDTAEGDSDTNSTSAAS